MSYPDLSNVFPSFRCFLINVLNARVGVFARKIELLEVSTGVPALERKAAKPIGDRFKFKVPMCDVFSCWEVIFNCSYPNCPPDFELNDSDFLDSLDTDGAEGLFPSLAKWNCKQDNALYNVITELRTAFLNYQVEKFLDMDNRYAHEYKDLVVERKFPRESVEVIINVNTIQFLIRLNVDLHCQDLEDMRVVLSLHLGKYGNHRVAKIYTSPNATRNLGVSLELPRNIQSDETVGEYVDEVTTSVENQVHEAVLEKEKKRKLFLFELMKHLGRQVLSFDALDFYCASFLLEKNEFVCLLDVKLPPEFPGRPPCYRLLSVYVKNIVYANLPLPFNDKWDSNTMVEQALHVIKSKYMDKIRDDTIAAFQIPK